MKHKIKYPGLLTADAGDKKMLMLEAIAEVNFEAAGDDGESKQPTFSM